MDVVVAMDVVDVVDAGDVVAVVDAGDAGLALTEQDQVCWRTLTRLVLDTN
jgi:hypothetical protein